MNKYEQKKTIAEWLIPLSCIFLQYPFVISSVGLILLFIYCVTIILLNRRIYINKKFILLTIGIIIQQFIVFLYSKYELSLYIKNIANIVLIVFIFIIATQDINREKVYKNYRVIGLISSIVIYIQTFQLTVLNKSVGAIKVMPVLDESYWVTNNSRPCAFFTEPQTFCTYMAPLLILSLKRKDYITAICLSIAMICSTSSIGILIVILLWAIELVLGSISIKIKIGVGIIILCMISCFFTLDQFSFAREKLLGVIYSYQDYSNTHKDVFSNPESYSNYLRILKGKRTFEELPSLQKIVGIGNNNLINYIENTNEKFSWMGIWKEKNNNWGYMSSLFGIFVEFGLIIGILYYLILYFFIRKSTSTQKKIIYLILLQSIITQFFFNGVFTFYFLIFFTEGRTYKRDYWVIKLR